MFMNTFSEKMPCLALDDDETDPTPFEHHVTNWGPGIGVGVVDLT